MRQRTGWAAIQYLLAVGLLVWLLWANWEPSGGPGLKLVYLTYVVQGVPVRASAYAAAVLLCLLAVLLTLVRWHVLTRLQGLPVRLGDTLRVGAVGLFDNTFLPGALGGDVVKAVLLTREDDRRATAVATILADPAVRLWSLQRLPGPCCCPKGGSTKRCDRSAGGSLRSVGRSQAPACYAGGRWDGGLYEQSAWESG